MKKYLFLLTSVMCMCGIVIGCGNQEKTAGDVSQSTEGGYELEYQTENMNAEYALRTDGMYVCGDYTYRYKLWLTNGNTYTVLSNSKDVTYDDVERRMASSGEDAKMLSEYIPIGYYFTDVICEVGDNGDYLYNGNSYKNVMMFEGVSESSSAKCFYTVLTNDTSITLENVVNASAVDKSEFVVIDRREK